MMFWPFTSRRYRLRGRESWWRFFPRLWRLLHWGLRLLLLLLVVDLFYVANIWPNWQSLAKGPIPKSNFIVAYEKKRVKEKKLPRLHWYPVSFSIIPAHVLRAAIVAEDARFYSHSGFDFIAFREAMDYNWSEGKFALGGSTISQQTVKNMFLSASRDPLRKWHELLMTWGMERNLKKNRIIEMYLNIAEFGLGIYGVEAASRAYWQCSVSELTRHQAAELAATLPSPKKHNPKTRTKTFNNRTAKILYWLEVEEMGPNAT